MDGEQTPGSETERMRTVDAGRGLGWWSDAWALFMRNPGVWVVQGLIVIVVMIVLGFIPFVGFVATTLLLPVLGGGWLLQVRKLEAGDPVEIGDLFAAFRSERLTPLVVLGALLLAMSVAIGVVMGVLGLGGVLGVVAGGARDSAGGVLAGLGVGLLALLAGFLLGALVTMAMWFATPLVTLRATPPVDALRLSFTACLRNFVPFLVYGVIYFVAAIVASIPLGLGWLVLAPLTMLTVYVSYKDVFAPVAVATGP